MLSTEILLSYPIWNIHFILHTNAYDKQFDGIIIQNNKPIVLFSRRLINWQRNYTTTEK